jgi:hypothetical protein
MDVLLKLWIQLVSAYVGFLFSLSMLIMADLRRMQTVTTLNVSKVIKRKIMPMSNDNIRISGDDAAAPGNTGM